MTTDCESMRVSINLGRDFVSEAVGDYMKPLIEVGLLSVVYDETTGSVKYKHIPRQEMFNDH